MSQQQRFEESEDREPDQEALLAPDTGRATHNSPDKKGSLNYLSPTLSTADITDHSEILKNETFLTAKVVFVVFMTVGMAIFSYKNKSMFIHKEKVFKL